jgi:hypothetical protein
MNLNTFFPFLLPLNPLARKVHKTGKGEDGGREIFSASKKQGGRRRKAAPPCLIDLLPSS